MRRVISYTVGILCLSLILRTWVALGVVEPVRVLGNSMSPLIQEGDALLIDRTACLWSTPGRWQTVVLLSPAGAELCIKRIVGLPGEEIDIRQGSVVVDGRRLTHPLSTPQAWGAPRNDETPEIYYLPRASGQRLRKGPWRLKEDEYFVLGDNSSVSIDSRAWGPIPERLIVGIPVGVR
ncbi:signal peptidase I [Adhaeretor mobilis]|nr:signal peptidase I [Adhaeretor mobilis]